MSAEETVTREFSTPKRESKQFSSIHLVTTSPPMTENNVYPWNWGENIVKIELQSPRSNMNSLNASTSESPDIRGTEGKRGRPRADDINALINEGAQSPSSIKCNICNRVFPREKSLQAHKRTHTGDRPYQCDYPGCTKAFTQSGQLKTHQRLHTGEKPFICSAPGCKSRFTHANRHCSEHPYGKLQRVSDAEINLQMVPADCSDDVLRWLEKYQNEKADRTPAKRPNTKMDELDETPNGSNVYSPSSDSDIMSPPPLKKNKSRRGLGPLMDEHLMREQSVIRHNISNEENYPTQSFINRRDENYYTSPLHHNHRIVPASPLRTRVLNSENMQTPNKIYRDFAIDGIKPLMENEDEPVPLRKDFSAKAPLATSSPISFNKAQSHYTLSLPTHSYWQPQPPENIFEEERYYPTPTKTYEPVKYLSPAPKYLPTDLERLPVQEKHSVHSLPSEVLSVPLAQPIYYRESRSYPQEEESLAIDLTDPKVDKENPETWRMQLPKKKWLSDYRHSGQSYKEEYKPEKQDELAHTYAESETKVIESQKLMGAVALIQLAMPQEAYSEPLNLSTSKYSDT